MQTDTQEQRKGNGTSYAPEARQRQATQLAKASQVLQAAQRVAYPDRTAPRQQLPRPLVRLQYIEVKLQHKRKTKDKQVPRTSRLSVQAASLPRRPDSLKTEFLVACSAGACLFGGSIDADQKTVATPAADAQQHRSVRTKVIKARATRLRQLADRSPRFKHPASAKPPHLALCAATVRANAAAHYGARLPAASQQLPPGRGDSPVLGRLPRPTSCHRSSRQATTKQLPSNHPALGAAKTNQQARHVA